MGKKVRSTVTGLLGVSMALSTVSSVQAQSVNDISGHWAEQKIQKWLDEDNLKGYQDGSFKPNQTITRAEFVAMINRLFGYTETTEINFKDLNTQNWAYKDIAAAVKAGYVTGYENQTIRPGAPVTRQEAAVIVSKILGVNPIDSGILNQFTDAEQIASWGKSGITVAIENEVMKGYPNRTFSPTKSLTRAEAVSLIDTALLKKDILTTTTYDKAGTYGAAEGTEIINGNVVISAPGVVLQNVEIKGNLTLAEGIGEGDVTIKNVKVHGTTNVQGGGINSIHFVDSVLVNVIVNKKDGTVRIVAEGSTRAESVVVQSSVKLEESGVSGVGFTDVELAAELPANAQVVLNGTFDDVDISAASISVQLQRGSIETLNISDAAKNASINLSSGTSVTKLILDAIAKLLGSGSIKSAVINEGGEGSEFSTRPTTVEGPLKEKIIVSTPPVVSGGGSSDSSSGSTGGGGTSTGGGTGTNPDGGGQQENDAQKVAAAKKAIQGLDLAWDTDLTTTITKVNTAISKVTLPTGVKIVAVEGTELNAGNIVITITSGTVVDESIVIKAPEEEPEVPEQSDAEKVAEAKTSIEGLNLSWKIDLGTTVAAANEAIQGLELPTSVTAVAEANGENVVITITSGTVVDESIVI
ncbi:S-layer homology domain-containing protein, partial [Paenibacillus sp. GCM10028914]|uniref:S-layer homology domain-containing protein n=1 Tax=Paenibacillus sp. GCM10028914 TaxID=3273416 RepID=UPI0036090B07